MDRRAIRVTNQDAPQNARMILVRAADEPHRVYLFQRRGEKACHAVLLAAHAFEEVYAFVTEAAASPGGAELGSFGKRFFEQFGVLFAQKFWVPACHARMKAF